MKIRNLLSGLGKFSRGKRASDAQQAGSATGRPAARRRRVPRGAPPGTIVVDPAAQAPSLLAFGYGDGGLEEVEPEGLDGIAALRARWPRIWISVQGLGDAAFLTEIGKFFGLHALALEDVVNVYQHAKVDQFPGHVFVVARLAKPGDPLDTDQVSLFVGEGFVLSFEERRQPFFDPVRVRLRQGARRVLGAGTDHLAYLLLDNVVDSYFPVLEEFGERIDRLEDELLLRPSRHSIRRIHRIKKDLLQLRRAIWPHREMLADLLHSDEAGISDDTRIHLRDCQDHVVQILDLIETYRETCADLMDVYMSSASNRMGEVMKVLTVITTIFIPLSFVAGVYGMNFDPAASPWNMPELRWAWGYPACLAAMSLIAGSLLVYFWRKGWLRSDKP